MKNIEKYNESKAALNAYNSLVFKRVPFDVWLECEYEEPPKPTLIEAAEAIVKIVSSTPTSVTRNLFRELRLAVEREKANPVRNCDKYKTAKDAFAGFNKMCEEKKCGMCPFSAARNECNICKLNWLYAEAEKEESRNEEGNTKK